MPAAVDSSQDTPVIIGGSTPPGPGRKVIILAALLILAGVANHLPSVNWGFLYDDFIHQFALRYLPDSPHPRSWSLYDFGPRPEPEDPLYKWGLFPWWTSPDFKIRFFRPVASLSILLDFALYDDWAPGYHLTNLILFAVFLALAFKLYCDLGAPPRAALWALALLALEDNHVVPVGWIAHRNTLLAALFTVATLLCVHHYRRRRGLGYLIAAMLCFLLACGSKEEGIMTLPMIGLYLLLLDHPSHGEAFLQRCHRVLRSGTTWIFIFLAVAYAGFYLAAGYGARSDVYPTPWGDTGPYLLHLAALVPLAFMSLLFGLSTDIVYARPDLIPAAVGVSVPILAVVGVLLWRRLRSAPLAAFALGWTLLALLPVAGVTPSDRLLMLASVGSALLIGTLMNYLGPWRTMIAARQYRRLAVAAVFVLIGIVVTVPAAYKRSEMFSVMAKLDLDAIAGADIDPAAPAPRSVFLLNSPSSLLALTVLPTWAVVHKDLNTHIFFFQMGRRALTCERDSDNSMVLTCESPPLLDHRYEKLFWTEPNPPPPGATFTTAEFAVTVRTVEPTGIRTVRLEFRRSLDHPSYRFLACPAGRLERVDLPPVGGTIRIPPASPTVLYAP